MKLMIFEDEPQYGRLLMSRAIHRDMECRINNTGDHYIEDVTAFHPDIIILDMNLPRVNGLEVVEGLQHNNQTSRIPIVILSASGEKNLFATALLLGARKYFVKGENLGEVFEYVEKIA